LHLIIKERIMQPTRIHTDHAPAAVGPYSQGIAAGDFVFCAGQAGLDPATGKLVEGDVQVQARRVLDNLKAVLEAAGTDLAHVVKTSVFLADMADFKAMNEVYATYFPGTPPARTTIAAKALPLGALIEIECIAVNPGSGVKK
jgi:2-iminobutanoate/2-iminopropanoate deaminase